MVNEAKDFVSTLLKHKLDSRFTYHNLNHTQRVVKSVKTLLNFHKLETKEEENLLIAAWFHDTGYTTDLKNHEETSCEIATRFLSDRGYTATGIAKVCAGIRATRRHYQPQNLYEAMLRDADASHFADKNYNAIAESLRKELQQLGIAQYSISAWRDENIAMFRNEHQFYTPYAQQYWEPKKQENLAQLLKAR